MAADEPAEIAAQIDNNPDLVGVKPASERDDAAADERPHPTWGDVFESVGADGAELSETQLATALVAHPALSFQSARRKSAARERIHQATGSTLVPRRVETPMGTDTIAGYRVEDDADV